MILLSDKYWEIKNTKRKGRGVFAKKNISKGTVIGDYIGKVVRPQDALVDEENFYLMYYHDHAAILPDLKKPGSYLINHSCNPNSFLYTFKGHTLVFALTQILKDEEITIPYLLSPIDNFCDPCLHNCQCETKNCTGTMHLSNERYLKWKKLNDLWANKTKRERVYIGKELPPLLSYPKTISAKYINGVNKIFRISK